MKNKGQNFRDRAAQRLRDRGGGGLLLPFQPDSHCLPAYQLLQSPASPAFCSAPSPLKPPPLMQIWACWHSSTEFRKLIYAFIPGDQDDNSDNSGQDDFRNAADSNGMKMEEDAEDEQENAEEEEEQDEDEDEEDEESPEEDD